MGLDSLCVGELLTAADGADHGTLVHFCVTDKAPVAAVGPQDDFIKVDAEGGVNIW